MNISTSECSSGCESGWTMYLDQSSNSQENNRFIQQNNQQDFISYKYKSASAYLDGCDEGEDLSMVSDASSGPPHFGDDENDEYCFDEKKVILKKKNKNKEKKSGKKEQYLYLDDTASSPLKQNHMVLPPSGASMEHETHYKEKSAFQKHIDFFQSSMTKKSSSGAAAGSLKGRNWD